MEGRGRLREKKGERTPVTVKEGLERPSETSPRWTRSSRVLSVEPDRARERCDRTEIVSSVLHWSVITLLNRQLFTGDGRVCEFCCPLDKKSRKIDLEKYNGSSPAWTCMEVRSRLSFEQICRIGSLSGSQRTFR